MQTIDNYQDDKTKQSIRQALVRMLARRDYSEQELIQKLLAKGHVVENIQPIITDFVQSGYINEARFVENYLHFRRNKGFGPLRIISELKARGIVAEKIAEAMQIADNDWLILAKRVWQKQFKGQQPTDFHSRAKQMRFLLYRGFTQEQAQQIITE